MSLDLATQKIELVTNIDDNGTPIRYANDLHLVCDYEENADNEENCKIYFTDSSAISPVYIEDRWSTMLPALADLLSGDPTGRYHAR